MIVSHLSTPSLEDHDDDLSYAHKILGGGAVNKANCTGPQEMFCLTMPFSLLESNRVIQLAIFNG